MPTSGGASGAVRHWGGPSTAMVCAERRRGQVGSSRGCVGRMGGGLRTASFRSALEGVEQARLVSRAAGFDMQIETISATGICSSSAGLGCGHDAYSGRKELCALLTRWPASKNGLYKPINIHSEFDGRLKTNRRW